MKDTPIKKGAIELYDTLYATYGNLNWWPASSPYEVMIGAVLTQNTAWENVEKAIANFKDSLQPEFIAETDTQILIDIIRPAGFFNQKAAYLKTLTAWYQQYNYTVQQVQARPLTELRKELLALRGIGPETADSILLYAFAFPSFVVDAYTKRLLSRLGISAGQNYDSIKNFFENQLPANAALFNNYHACIVIHAKTRCRSKPHCEACPFKECLTNHCLYCPS